MDRGHKRGKSLANPRPARPGTLIATVCVASSVLMAACGKRITVQADDPTPPILAMTVFGLPTSYPGASPGFVTVHPGDPNPTGQVVATAHLTFSATASDAESGLGLLVIRGETTAICQPEGSELAESRHAQWASPPFHEAVPVGGQARASVAVSLDFVVAEVMRCNGDASIHGAFHAEARNNHSMSVITSEVAFSNS